MRAPNTDKVGKGIAKVNENERIFETRDGVTGKRKVKVLDQPLTYVYTSCDTDEEAIIKYHKAHGTDFNPTTINDNGGDN